MSHYQEDDAEYMADEYDMEDIDDDMVEEFLGRDMSGSDSDVDEYDDSVCFMFYKIHIGIFKQISSCHHSLRQIDNVALLFMNLW